MKSSVLSLLLMLLLTGCVSDKEEPVWSLQPGDELPEFTVEVNGTPISTGMLRGCRSVIIFFNTNCKDCHAALPKIQEAYDKAVASDEDVRYLCIAREEGEEEIREYWRRHDLTLPYAAQTGRTVYNMFATSGIPRVYISNENLIIEKVYE